MFYDTMRSLGPKRGLSRYWFRALPPETSAYPQGCQGTSLSAPLLSGRITVATHPYPACHNNPPRDKTQNSKSKQASPKKEVRLLHRLSQPHLPPLTHSTQTQSPPLLSPLRQVALPHSPAPQPHSPRTHMAHCNFSFLMELYKAWGGRNKSGQCGSVLGEGEPHVPQCQSSEPSLPTWGRRQNWGRGQQGVMT